MPSRQQLVRHDAPLPAHITLQPGALSGVDAVTPLLLALYNSDPEAQKEMSSYCKDNSPNGGVNWDKARIVHKVRELNRKGNGGNPMIADANDAQVGLWCSWGARRLDGIARSKRLKAAKANLLAAQNQPAPEEEESGS